MTHVGGPESQAHISPINIGEGLWIDLDETPGSEEERSAQLDALAFRAVREILLQTRDKRARLRAAELVMSKQDTGGSFADAVAELLKGS